jgi:hypothetical protein
MLLCFFEAAQTSQQRKIVFRVCVKCNGKLSTRTQSQYLLYMYVVTKNTAIYECLRLERGLNCLTHFLFGELLRYHRDKCYFVIAYDFWRLRKDIRFVYQKRTRWRAG